MLLAEMLTDSRSIDWKEFGKSLGLNLAPADGETSSLERHRVEMKSKYFLLQKNKPKKKQKKNKKNKTLKSLIQSRMGRQWRTFWSAVRMAILAVDCSSCYLNLIKWSSIRQNTLIYSANS